MQRLPPTAPALARPSKVGTKKHTPVVTAATQGLSSEAHPSMARTLYPYVTPPETVRTFLKGVIEL